MAKTYQVGWIGWPTWPLLCRSSSAWYRANGSVRSPFSTRSSLTSTTVTTATIHLLYRLNNNNNNSSSSNLSRTAILKHQLKRQNKIPSHRSGRTFRKRPPLLPAPIRRSKLKLNNHHHHHHHHKNAQPSAALAIATATATATVCGTRYSLIWRHWKRTRTFRLRRQTKCDNVHILSWFSWSLSPYAIAVNHSFINQQFINPFVTIIV